jgi:hypothetical protein
MAAFGPAVIAIPRGLLLVFLAVLMQFLAGLDRVQSLWHPDPPASVAWPAGPHVTRPG